MRLKIWQMPGVLANTWFQKAGTLHTHIISLLLIRRTALWQKTVLLGFVIYLRPSGRNWMMTLTPRQYSEIRILR